MLCQIESYPVKKVKHRWVISSCSLLLLILLPHFITSPYFQHVLIFIFIYTALGSAWNIIGGYAGQWSLGHAAFFGIGAYTSTLFLMHFNLTPWIGMILGGIVAMMVSLCVGFPCFKLRTHYFAMATITFGEIMRLIFLWLPFTEGAMGLTLPIGNIPSLYHMLWANKIPYYYIALSMTLGVILLTYQIDRSRLGLYLKAIKQDEDAARNLGINATQYKMIAMGISSFLTAMMGSLYAQYTQYIDPEAVMPFMLSLFMILIPIFGGLGTIFGPVLGGIILTPLAEMTRVLLGGKGVGLDSILYGAVIIIFSIYFPGGVVAFFKMGKSKKWIKTAAS